MANCYQRIRILLHNIPDPPFKDRGIPLQFLISLPSPCIVWSKGMSTSVRECECGMRDWGEPKQMPKSSLFGVHLVKRMPSIANVFLKYWLQMDRVRLFTEHSLFKQMLFAAPRLRVHINISLIFACLIRH